MHTSVPFTLEAYEGFAEVEGLVRFDGEALELEFQTKDAIMGLVRSAVKEVRLALPDVVSAVFTKRTFKATLQIQARSMGLLAELPGARQGTVTLRFARKHRDAAHALASQLQLRLSEHKLDAMDDDLRRLNEL